MFGDSLPTEDSGGELSHGGELHLHKAAEARTVFLALRYSDIAALVDFIGTRTMVYFGDVIRTAVSDALPSRPIDTTDARKSISAPQDVPHTDQSFGYSVLCLDFGDEEVSQRITDVVAPLVERLSKILPMFRHRRRGLLRSAVHAGSRERPLAAYRSRGPE